MKTLSRIELLDRYRAGENITKLLRGSDDHNSKLAIEFAYDLQAGSYSANMQKPGAYQHKVEYGREIARRILSFDSPTSLMEAGVGEATTLSFVLKNISVEKTFAFDLSWSRINTAKKWLAKEAVQQQPQLFTADLFKIPLPDNSVDVVYTSHTIEPNGGKEHQAISELYRVAKNWLVLLEPAFEFADDESQQRMKHHGYCINLHKAVESAGFDVVVHEPFSKSANPKNPTGITVIRKPQASSSTPVFTCPVTACELVELDGAYFSPDHLAAYPILKGIPCLRPENAILCSNFLVSP